MVIGNRYLQGSPILPYANAKAYPGNDMFMDLQFVDHTNTPVVPTSISIEIDDITNNTIMTGPTALSAAGSVSGSLIYPAFAASMYVQIAASVLAMTYPYQGSQLCQVSMKFTAIDSVTGLTFNGSSVVAIIELCALDTVSGQ